ncbi:MAG: hypothetical protein A3J38_03110 [Gammaproteobacteria bacterium RIFCSPHIGHO2_12_FULL_45_9]|nr:MAG: hypothetical protein A3J38_03110 [Gammaproteobacteria bacterium RIFCSPHIGHO2_12_FULL_45_9]
MSLKLIAALCIFVLTLVGGLIPLLTRTDSRKMMRFFYWGDCFAAGIFMGVGLIHLLPDAITQFQVAYPAVQFPVIPTVCAATLFFVHLLEQKGGCHMCHHGLAARAWLPLLLTGLLSTHALVEGVALGISESTTRIALIFAAIFIHKWAESFVLGLNFRHNELPFQMTLPILVLFSSMTPLGIAGGAALDTLLSDHAIVLAQACISAIAAGTFIYVATLEPERAYPGRKPDDPHYSRFSGGGLLYFGLGIGLMGVVAGMI